MNFRYDPRSEACLTALTTGVKPEATKVSLVQALESADELTALAGSTPGETVAMIEYLLALIYASGHVPRTPGEWRTWVQRGEPLAPAAVWLGEQPDGQWNLFDPVQPLGQNIQLAPFLDEHGVGPAQIVIEQTGDYNQFFEHTHLHHPEPMPADAAFRALLTQMVYGPGGNAKVKKDWLGPLLFPQSVSRLGGRIRVLALGRTLGETLRLNLTPTAGRDLGTFNRSWTDGRPRRVFRGAKVTRMPDGPADAHSYLCRSVLLHPIHMHDGALAVDRVLMGSGEVLPALPARFLQDAVLVKSRENRVPLKPSTDRAMWQQAHALYAAVADRDKGGDLYGHLATLPGTRVDLWAVGLIARQTVPVAWVADEFPYIPGREMDFREAAEGGSDICEYVDKALWAAADAAREIVYPNPKPADIAKQRERFNAAPGMWAGAGEHFHVLLDAIAEGLDPAEALTGFAAKIAAIATEDLDARLKPLPNHGPGMQARLNARVRLREKLTGRRAPHPLKEASRA
jgi:CRISPR system Cascade subunit CasA